MQPLSLQNRPMVGRSPLLNAGNAGTAVRQPNTLSQGSTGNAAGGQFDMMSLLMPILQLVTMALTMSMGSMGGAAGQQGANPAGNPGAGGTGGTNNAQNGASGGGGVTGGGNAAPDQATGKTVDPTQTVGATDPKLTALAGDPSTANSKNGQGNALNMSINDRRNIDYSALKADPNGGGDYGNVRGGKQAFNGVTGRDAAIMHMGGRGHISAATTANGVSGSARIYNNVLNNPGNFTPDEVKLIKGYADKEKAKYGYFTGEGLDHDFVNEMATRGDIPKDKVAEYHKAIDDRVSKMVNNPNQAAVAKEAGQEVNITSDIGTLQKQSGLSPYEQAVYRLAGHATLFSGDGSINGDVLPISLNNKNSLDGRSFAGQNTNIDPQTLSLLQDDLASDGKLNGDSLRYANEKVLDKIFLGAPGATESDTMAHAVQKGSQNGRSRQDIMKSLQTSANDAIKQFGGLMKKHPVITAMGAGALGAGAGVCPFLAGTMAVGAGIAAGSKMMSQDAKPSSGGSGGGY